MRTTARRDGDGYVINGAKTFITNGQNANLVVVVCRTGSGAGAKNISLLMVETDRPGFRRGRQLDKVGLKTQDTSELFFDDVRVPTDNLLGGVEGQGFFQLMRQLAQERLIIAVSGIGAMQCALDETVRYTKERKAFGKTVWDFQNTRFKLAEVQAVVLAARAVRRCPGAAHLRRHQRDDEITRVAVHVRSSPRPMLTSSTTCARHAAKARRTAACTRPARCGCGARC